MRIAKTVQKYRIYSFERRPRMNAAPEWAPPPNERRTNYFQKRRLIEATSESLKT